SRWSRRSNQSRGRPSSPTCWPLVDTARHQRSAAFRAMHMTTNRMKKRRSDPRTQSKMKRRSEDVLRPEPGGEIDVNVAKRQKPSAKRELLDDDFTVESRQCGQGLRYRKRAKPREHSGASIVFDDVTIDDMVEETIRKLVTSAPPLALPDPKEHDVRECKKAGRPAKRFRGRCAKEKQAIRNAEIAERVAIRQRQLPVLDLTLKVIEDLAVEPPLESPMLVHSSIFHETALLHEVGEALQRAGDAKVSTSPLLNELTRKVGNEVLSDILTSAIRSILDEEGSAHSRHVKPQKRTQRTTAQESRASSEEVPWKTCEENQAIRDAKIAEEVAIKQRELPILDLTLKVIEDPAAELPPEAPITVDLSIIYDTTLLKEVSEVLRELVAHVCLEELHPKRVVSHLFPHCTYFSKKKSYSSSFRSIRRNLVHDGVGNKSYPNECAGKGVII
ncbi:hypothetical protein KIN20_015499, partial [Parelaphostrongylus tenuis]